METVEIHRKTTETEIKLKLEPFKTEPSKLNSSIPFLDHMLSHICKHGRMKVDLDVTGDIEVDYHHTVEDVAIVLGEAIDQGLKDMTGVTRYGHCTLPMEEALVTVAIDIRKSPHFEYKVPDVFVGTMGTFDCELVKEFFRALAIYSRMNVHIVVHYGDNKHHIAEGIFKCFGRAFSMAAAKDEAGVLYSTKGVL